MFLIGKIEGTPLWQCCSLHNNIITQVTKICIFDLMYIWVMKSCNWWRWCQLHNTSLIHGCKSLWMLACCIVSLSNTLKFQCIPLFIYCMPLLRKRKWILQVYNIALMDYHDIFRRFQGAIRTSTSRSTIKIVWRVFFGFVGFLFPLFFMLEIMGVFPIHLGVIKWGKTTLQVHPSSLNLKSQLWEY